MYKKLIVIVLLLFINCHAIGRRLYVDSAATGNNTGSSWINAYTNIASALNVAAAATTVDSILIAAGIYYPTGVQSSTVQTTSFTIFRGGIRLYGGYPRGGGTRNVTTHPVVLNGNIANLLAATDNSFHVMVIAGASGTDSIVLDGLTITNGSALGDGKTTQFNGKTIKNGDGGGIYIIDNTPAILIKNCKISGNSATGTGSSTAYTASGGGIFITASQIMMNACVVSGNTANGGNGRTSQIGNNVRGAAAYGAGIYSSNATLLVYNSVFHDNIAMGGNNPSGMVSVPTGAFGGGIYNAKSKTKIINCTFTKNRARPAATIVSRNIVKTGAAMYSDTATRDTIYNSIFWRNEGLTAIADSMGGIVGRYTQIGYSVVDSANKGAAILDLDPEFVNPSGQDYHLKAISPAINIGSNILTPAWLSTDITGSARIQLGKVDAGAYESSSFEPNIIGPSAACVGRQTTYRGNIAGGIFTSSNTTIATINANTGLLTALTPGTDTLYYVYGTTTVTKIINISASPMAGTISGPIAICQNDPVAYASTVSGGNWYSSSTTNLNINVNTGKGYARSGKANVYYVVTNTAGCRDTATLVVTTAAKTPAGPVLSSKPFVCPGDIVGFSSANPGIWFCDKPGSLQIDSVTAWAKAISSDTVTVYNVFTNSNGCKDTASLRFLILSPSTKATISTIPDLCPGMGGLAHCDIPGGSWYSSNPSLLTININTGVMQPLATGRVQIYYVVDTIFHCIDTAFMDVAILPPAKPIIIINGQTLATSQPYYYYEWYHNDTLIPGSNSRSCMITSPGKYEVFVIDTNSCWGTATYHTMTTISNTTVTNTIQLYPNPAETSIFINGIPESTSYSITDITGRVLIKGVATTSVLNIDVQNLTEGIYLFRVAGRFIKFSKQ